jgi:hypothetical protein
MSKNKEYINPLYRDKVLGNIIDWTTQHGIQLSLQQMISFDPQKDDNYEENWSRFVKEQSIKEQSELSEGMTLQCRNSKWCDNVNGVSNILIGEERNDK